MQHLTIMTLEEYIGPLDFITGTYRLSLDLLVWESGNVIVWLQYIIYSHTPTLKTFSVTLRLT